jgi:hypothetical protein
MDIGEIPSIGSRRELFVDRFLVDTLDGARLKLNEPTPAGVAIKYDTSEEGYPDHPISFYTTVFKDDDLAQICDRRLWPRAAVLPIDQPDANVVDTYQV